MKPQPIPTAMLRPRVPDGSYPFRDHRSCAEAWDECGPMPAVGGHWQFSNVHFVAQPIPAAPGWGFIPVCPQTATLETSNAD